MVTLVALAALHVSTVVCVRKIGLGLNDAVIDGGAVQTCVAGS
jgi:predicted ribosome-associated RNA-binding protein Tma20